MFASTAPLGRLPRRQLLLSLLAAAASSLSPRDLGAAQRTVCIQPLGDVLPDEDVNMVKRALESFFAVELATLPRAELPAKAFYHKRRRWRAEVLLRFLEERRPAHAHRILGLTAADISTTKPPHEDWGILGMATLDGAACVLSSFRCARATTPSGARIRLGKVAVHEIGHTFGLEHCPKLGCLMEDGRGSALTCDRDYDLCPRCRERLTQAGHPLAQATDPPWPRTPNGK